VEEDRSRLAVATRVVAGEVVAVDGVADAVRDAAVVDSNAWV
jgi:hypothetical protein